RAFVTALLNRTRALIQNPASAAPTKRYSEPSQIFMALSRLESMIAGPLADLSPAVAEARANVFSLLTQAEQQRTGETLSDPPKRTFDEQIEAADRLADASRRESGIGMAILNGVDSETLEKIEAAAAKLDDV